MPEWRKARERNAGTATYLLVPRAMLRVWLESDISQMSNSCPWNTRWKVSSGSSAIGTTLQPSMATRPSKIARVRS